MENSMRILDAHVFDYGAQISIRVENGPLLPHTDKRFPQERVRVIKLTATELLRIANGR